MAEKNPIEPHAIAKEPAIVMLSNMENIIVIIEQTLYFLRLLYA